MRFLATLAFAALPVISTAGQWPERPINLIYPFAPGSTTDAVVRTLAEGLSKEIGQPVVVVNRPGASGTIGTNAVAKAKDKDYTLLATMTMPIMASQFLYSKLPYDVDSELSFVSQIATSRVLIAVHPSVPANTMDELEAWVRESGVSLNMGTWGAGSYPHLAATHLSRSRGMSITSVAYKGETPMLSDLVGGQIHIGMGSLNSMEPFIESGHLKPIAISGDRRLERVPNIPTYAEAGLDDPELEPVGWLVLMAPKSMGSEQLGQLESATMKVTSSEEFNKYLESINMIPMAHGSAAFRADFDRAMPPLEKLITTMGIKLD